MCLLCLFISFRYDYVEVEEPDGGLVLGRWCGSQAAPGPLTSKGTQIRIRFISDEYFPSEPGFSIHYSIMQQVSSLPQRLSLSLKICNYRLYNESWLESQGYFPHCEQCEIVTESLSLDHSSLFFCSSLLLTLNQMIQDTLRNAAIYRRN